MIKVGPTKFNLAPRVLANTIRDLRKGIYRGEATDFFTRASNDERALFVQASINRLSYNAGTNDAIREFTWFTRECLEEGIIPTLRKYYKNQRRFEPRLPELSADPATEIIQLTKSIRAKIVK